VYEFYIQENIAQGPLLPLPGWIFPKTEFFHYGLEITPDTLGDDFSQGPFKLKESAIFPDYYEFTVSMPESVMWKAQLYDLDGNIVCNHLFSTWININARKYYVSSPGAGYYHGKLWVKNRGEERYSTIAAEFSIDSRNENLGPVHLPENYLIIDENYYRYGIESVRNNYEISAFNDVYSINLISSDGFPMTCKLYKVDEYGEYIYGSNEKPVVAPLHYTYTCTDNNSYTFMFSYPGEGMYKAKMFIIEDNGTWKTMAHFLLQEQDKHGPFLPLEGTISIKKNFHEYNLLLNHVKLSSELGEGYYSVSIEHPDSVLITSTIKDLDNESYSDFKQTSTLPGLKTIYFTAPGKGVFKGVIYAKNEGEESSRIVADFLIVNNTEELEAIPPPYELIFYKRFTENGFVYIDDNIRVRNSNDPYEVRIRCAPDFKMDCRLKTESDDPENVYGYYSSNKQGDIYTFTFIEPEEQRRFRAKIYQIDTEGNWNTVCYFIIN